MLVDLTAGETPLTATRSGPGGSQQDARFIGDVLGCFVFLDRSGDAWETQAYPFSARSVTAYRAAVSADTTVTRGERVALRFDTIGIRRGVVERSMKGGFIVELSEDEAVDTSIQKRIDWLKRRSLGRAEENRLHKRVVPRSRNAILILGANDRQSCRIKDMSPSGAAIVADVRPPIGNLLAIGAVPARVSRHSDDGFGVRFLETHPMAELEKLLTTGMAAQRLRGAVNAA